jgi:hypothetical protein
MASQSPTHIIRQFNALASNNERTVTWPELNLVPIPGQPGYLDNHQDMVGCFEDVGTRIPEPVGPFRQFDETRERLIRKTLHLSFHFPDEFVIIFEHDGSPATPSSLSVPLPSD